MKRAEPPGVESPGDLTRVTFVAVRRAIRRSSPLVGVPWPADLRPACRGRPAGERDFSSPPPRLPRAPLRTGHHPGNRATRQCAPRSRSAGAVPSVSTLSLSAAVVKRDAAVADSVLRPHRSRSWRPSRIAPWPAWLCLRGGSGRCFGDDPMQMSSCRSSNGRAPAVWQTYRDAPLGGKQIATKRSVANAFLPRTVTLSV